MNYLASELLKMAKEVVAIDFGSQEELDTYMRQHPEGDKRNHRVMKPEQRTQSPEQQSKPLVPVDKLKSEIQDALKKPEVQEIDFDSHNPVKMRETVDRYGKSYRKFESYFMDEAGKSEEEANDLITGVRNYTASHYGLINAIMRGTDYSNVSQANIVDAKKVMDRTTEFLKLAPDKVPPTVPLYRGSRLATKDVDSILQAIDSGNEPIMDEKSFTSASMNTMTANQFIKANTDKRTGVMMRIKGKSGVCIANMSTLPGEGEVLFPPSKFKVTGYYYADADRHRTDKKPTVNDMGFVVLDVEEV